MRRFLAPLVLSLAATSCGSPLVTATPLAANEQEYIGPVYTAPAADEAFICYTIPLNNAEPIYVHSSHMFQSAGGHHVLAFAIGETSTMNDAPHVCDDSDMANPTLRFVGAGTAGGSGITMPDGVALMIPAHVKLMLQTHHVNTSGHEQQAQDIIHIETIARADVVQVAGAYAEVAQSFTLNARATATATLDCHPPAAMTVPWMFAHMHEWGTHATINVIHADGSTLPVYDSDWDVSFRDHFPLVNFATPLSLTPTDRVVTTCTWDNTTDAPIIFPKEMCATFMPIYPSDGTFWVCGDDGSNYTLGSSSP